MAEPPERASDNYPDGFDPLELPEEYFFSLGMKCGLEIHQQLRTRDKLFCRCEAVTRNGDHDAEILRHMRPTLSELGEYDGTALMEFKTKKNVVYQLFNDIVCTYEMDDTPPFEVNVEAMNIVVELCLLMGCSVVDEIHISRKQYLDGSIPTGFQRTAIVGINGKVPYMDREIGIIQVALEEDACREVSDIGHTITFRTDRLSIPLTEVVTYPDIRSPKEAGEVAKLLGRLMRCTHKIRRGSGATRQDVNVSIDGSRRVEIKGVPKWQEIPCLVAHEALRQKALLEITEEALSRGLSRELLEDAANIKLVTDIICSTRSEALGKAIKKGWRIIAVRLPKLGGLLDRNIGPKRRFWRDFEGRIRVIACLDSLPNMMILSMMEWNKVSSDEVLRLKKAMGWHEGDELVLTWGDEKDSVTAAKEVIQRALDILDGVPHETRQVMDDGTTDFERILPGADRMYPDTDSPPTKLSGDHLEAIRANMAETIWDREVRIKGLGVPEAIADRLVVSEMMPLFDDIIETTDAPPKFVATTLMETMKHLSRSGLKVYQITRENIIHMFELVTGGSLLPEAVPAVLGFMANSPDEGPERALEALDLFPIPPDQWKGPITKAVDTFDGGPDHINVHDAVMGILMAEARGRIPGNKASRIVTKTLSEKGLIKA